MPSTTTNVGQLCRGTTARRTPPSLPPAVADPTIRTQRLWPCMTELLVSDHRYRINEDKSLALRWIDSTGCWIAKSVRPVSYVCFLILSLSLLLRLLLADHVILVHSMIGYWHHNPSFCPSVTLSIVALRVGVDG